MQRQIVILFNKDADRAGQQSVSVPAKTVTHILIAIVVCFALLLAALFAFRLQVTPTQLRFEPFMSSMVK